MIYFYFFFVLLLYIVELINNNGFDLLYSNEIIDWFCLKDCKIDIDFIFRRYFYKLKIVLKVWIFIRIFRRINGVIYCSYIFFVKSYRKDLK